MRKLTGPLLLTSLTFMANAFADFQARVVNKGGGAVQVKEHLVDKSKYARSDSLTTPVELQFRGGCDSGERLKEFTLFLGENKYDIGVDGGNRHVSGNNGNSWSSHKVPAFVIPQNNSELIKACNNHVSQKLSQGYDLEAILASDSSLKNIHTDLSLSWQAVCKKNVGFSDPAKFRVAGDLQVDVLCKATGYKEPINVSDVQFKILETVNLSGSCKVNLHGSLRTGKPKQKVKFRYEHIDSLFNKKLSEVYEVTTDQQGYVNFSHSYAVANGPNKEQGKMRIIGVAPQFQSSQKNYSMDCVDQAAGSFNQATPSTIDLKATPVNSSKKAFGDQLCPTEIKFVGTIKAGVPISGQAVFIGQSLVDITTQAFSINKGQTKTFTRIRKLNWSAPHSTTLTLGGGGSAQPLMTQDVMQGLNIVGDNSQNVILSYPRKNFTFSCTHGSVTPGVQAPIGGFNTLPNHTGGGGAPTDLQSTRSVVPGRNVNTTKTVNPDKKQK